MITYYYAKNEDTEDIIAVKTNRWICYSGHFDNIAITQKNIDKIAKYIEKNEFNPYPELWAAAEIKGKNVADIINDYYTIQRIATKED